MISIVLTKVGTVFLIVKEEASFGVSHAEGKKAVDSIRMLNDLLVVKSILSHDLNHNMAHKAVHIYGNGDKNAMPIVWVMSPVLGHGNLFLIVTRCDHVAKAVLKLVEDTVVEKVESEVVSVKTDGKTADHEDKIKLADSLVAEGDPTSFMKCKTDVGLVMSLHVLSDGLAVKTHGNCATAICDTVGGLNIVITMVMSMCDGTIVMCDTIAMAKFTDELETDVVAV